ncbi:MAG: hypothetical protein GY795_41505 [Desulfobacterales bacterium]|nr:hypothetical protein [Desulfobacterales bacterium]
MKPGKITLKFSFNKITGQHQLLIDYESNPATPVYLHNKQHHDVLRQVSDILKKNGLSISAYEVVVRSQQNQVKSQSETEPIPISNKIKV